MRFFDYILFLLFTFKCLHRFNQPHHPHSISKSEPNGCCVVVELWDRGCTITAVDGLFGLHKAAPICGYYVVVQCHLNPREEDLEIIDLLLNFVVTQCDRMAADCALELRKHNVAYVSLWPGAVKTEIFSEMMGSDKADNLLAGFVSLI